MHGAKSTSTLVSTSRCHLLVLCSGLLNGVARMRITLALLYITGAVLVECGYITPGNGMPWGTWDSTVRFCPPNSYASAFTIKVEDHIDGDDTAMNGIQLYCRSTRNDREVGVRSSAVGNWGVWQGKRECNKGFFKAIRMRIENAQGRGDDTAANDLEMQCQNGETYNGGGTGWGSWSDWRYCPSGEVICGLQTRVEAAQGDGDDTALNDAIFACCRPS
ncbi:vitelline membrane outer layer protein 1 [Cherax quadricarinatus]